MPVMFSPANTTSPALGLSMLVIRLKTVDLPAPLGPITARISPGSTRQVDVVDRDQRAEAANEPFAFK